MALLHDGLTTIGACGRARPVDGVNLAPLASVNGGPPGLIGSWTGSRWIARAAREFDGWSASANCGGYDALKAGVER